MFRFFSIDIIYVTKYSKMDQAKFVEDRQPLKNLKGSALSLDHHTPSNFLKAVFHKFYLVHSLILCLIYCCKRNAKLVSDSYITLGSHYKNYELLYEVAFSSSKWSCGLVPIYFADAFWREGTFLF